MTNNAAEKLEGTAVSTTAQGKGIAVSKTDAIRDFITKQKGEFEKILPSHITFEKFQRVFMTAVIASKDLQEADRPSLMLACLKAATDGLLPDGRDAALVIFNKNTKTADGWSNTKIAQYMPMYAGILKKCRQSGQIASVVTHVVYEKDKTHGKFEYLLGDEEKIIHEPYMGTEDRGSIIAAYCIVKLKDGTIVREVMPWVDIEKIRRASPAGAKTEYDVKKSGGKIGDAKGIWEKWPEEMSRKTVFRRASKWLPQSIEDANRIFAADDTLGNDDNMPPEAEAEGASLGDMIAEGMTIDNETGEVLEGSALTQPDLKAEVERKKEAEKPKKDKPKSCDNCAGAGFRVDGDTKEPCKDCGGTGKAA